MGSLISTAYSVKVRAEADADLTGPNCPRQTRSFTR